MSTKSLIGIKLGNEVKYIYCHYDGYPEGVGAELRRNYSTFQTALELIDKGDCSTICGKVDAYSSWDDSDKRGDIAPKYVNKNDFNIKLGKNHNVDYMYLFAENKGWEIKCCYGYGDQPNLEDE